MNGYHSHGDGIVTAEPHTALVAKIKHQPILALAGKGGDRLAQARLENGFFIFGELDVKFGINIHLLLELDLATNESGFDKQ